MKTQDFSSFLLPASHGKFLSKFVLHGKFPDKLRGVRANFLFKQASHGKFISIDLPQPHLNFPLKD